MEIIRKEKSVSLKVKLRELVPVLAEVRGRSDLGVPGVLPVFGSISEKGKAACDGARVERPQAGRLGQAGRQEGFLLWAKKKVDRYICDMP